MSNRIDLYLPQVNELAVSALRLPVYLDGKLCEHLEVADIVRDSVEYSFARLRCSGDNIPAMASRVEIYQLYDEGIGQVRLNRLLVFAGNVEGIDKSTSAKQEIAEVIARDHSARLERVIVADQTFDTGQYGLAEIMHSLLSEYVIAGECVVPEVDRLKAMTQGQVVSELDVNGFDVIAALEKCCGETGVLFKFAPVTLGEITSQAIVFYRPGMGRSVELNLQRKGERLSLSQTNICQIESLRDIYTAGDIDFEEIVVSTPVAAMHYHVGDRCVCSPDSRDIIGVKSDNRSVFWVERVEMDIEKQCTRLRILRRRLGA